MSLGPTRVPLIHARPTGLGTLARHGFGSEKYSLAQSDNWAGWQDVADATNVFTYVRAEWNVPYFTCSPRRTVFGRQGSLAGTWVGLDGGAETSLVPDDSSLEQDGVSEACIPHRQGRAIYYTPKTWIWWEMIPAGPHVYWHKSPAMGDKIAASVQYAGSDALGEEFTLIVVDESNPSIALDVTVPCDVAAAHGGCPLQSSEAIQEWPGSPTNRGVLNGRQFTLTRYRPFAFYNYYNLAWSSVTNSAFYGGLSATSLWNVQAMYTTGHAFRATRRGIVPLRSYWPIQRPGPLIAPAGLGYENAFYQKWLAPF